MLMDDLSLPCSKPKCKADWPNFGVQILHLSLPEQQRRYLHAPSLAAWLRLACVSTRPTLSLSSLRLLLGGTAAASAASKVPRPGWVVFKGPMNRPSIHPRRFFSAEAATSPSNAKGGGDALQAERGACRLCSRVPVRGRPARLCLQARAGWAGLLPGHRCAGASAAHRRRGSGRGW